MKRFLYGQLIFIFLFSFCNTLFGQETKYKVEYNIEHNLYDYPDNDTNDDDYSDLRIRFFTSGIDIYNENLRFPDDENGLITEFDDVITTPAPETQLRYFYDTECPENNFQPFNNTFGLFDGCRENLLDTALRNWSPCVNITENYGRIVQLPSLLSDLNDDTTLQDCEPYTIEVAEACQAAQFSYALDYRLRDPLGSIIAQGELSSYGLKSSSFTFDLTDITNESPSDLGIIDVIVRYVENPSTPAHSAILALTPRACSIELRETDPIQIVDASCNSSNDNSNDNSNDGSITLNFKNDVETNFGMRYFIFQGNYTDFTGVVETVDGTTFPNQVFDEVLFSPTSPSGPLVANGDGSFRGTYSELDGMNTNPNPPPGEENQQNYYIIYQEVDYNSDPVVVKSGELIEQTFTIRQPAEISISIPTNNITQPVCSGDLGEVTLVGAGGGFDPNPNATLEYGIQKDGGAINWDNPTATFSNLDVGSYIFYARTSATCIGNASQVVTIDPVPTFEFDTTNTRIGQDPTPGGNDGSIEVELNGGVSPITLQIFNDAANPALVQSTLLTGNDRDHIFTGLPAGTYYLRAIDVNPCTITSVDTYELQSAPIPMLQEPVPTDPFCNNGNDGSVSMVITNPVSPYAYRILDNVGSQVSTGNGAASPSTPVTITANNLSNGSYSIEVIYNSGDFNVPATVATETFTLVNPPELTIGLVDVVGLGCNGTANGYIEISVSETGPLLQYSYRNLGTWIDLDPNLQIPITQTGTYDDIKFRTRRNTSDFVGCESTNELDNIFVPNGLTVTEDELLHQNVTTNGGNNGAIFIDVSGGNGNVANYTFEWTGVLLNGGGPYANNTQDIQNLLAGSYSVLVRDEKNCERTLGPILIIEPGPLSIQSFTRTNVSCNGENDGTLTALVQGTLPVTYTWILVDGSPNGTVVDSETNSLNTATLIGVAPGEYRLSVQDADIGPLLSPNTVIIEEPAAISAMIDLTPSCFNGDTGTITISNVAGGTLNPNPTYSYSVDDENNFEFSGTFTGISEGDHIVRIRENGGCILTQTVNIAATPAITWNEAASIVTNVSAEGLMDGAITPVFEGGFDDGIAPRFRYLWSGPNVGGIIDPSVSGLGPGTYSVIVTDDAGCTFPQDFMISEPGALSINIAAQQNPCFGETNGSITASIAGTGPYTLQWSEAILGDLPGETGLTLNNVGEGTYTLNVIDLGSTPNAVGNSAAVVLVEPQAITADIVTTASCAANDTGTIVISNVQGGEPGNPQDYTYSIDGIDFQDPPLFENLAAATYSVWIRDGNGCDLITSGVTIDPSPPIVWDEPNIIVTNATAQNASDGSITLAFTSDATNYTYQWNGPGTVNEATQNLIGKAAGVYTVIVTNENGCTLERIFTIAEPGILTITVSSTKNPCFGENNGNIQTTVVGTGNLSYQWSEAVLGDLIGETGPNLNNVPQGTYTLTVTDDAVNPPNVVSSNPVTLSDPAAILDAQVVSTNAQCAGEANGSVTITVSGGIPPYEYSIDAGVNYQAQASFNALGLGTYSIRVRDSNDCIADAAFTINEPPAITLSTVATPLSAAGFADGAIDIAASGGTGDLNFSWVGPPGFIPTTDEDISGLIAGEYVVTVQDENGCSFTSDSITIDEPGAIIIMLTINEEILCNGDEFGEIIADVQGGVPDYTYQWFQEGNNTALSETTNLISNLAAGNYFLRVTDANGISRNSNVLPLTEPNALQVTLQNKVDIVCSGDDSGSININVQGGTLPYTFQWSNGATSQNLANIEAGDYFVEVFDANGCSDLLEITINPAPDALQLEATVTNVSEYLANNGSIALIITGGSNPYTINWTKDSDNTPAGNSRTLTALAADNYTVVVSDANGCNTTETYEVTQPDIVEDTIVQPSCQGDTNGSISVLVNQGNGSFTYLWSTGEITNTISNLGAGNYSVTITGFGDGPLTRNYTLEDPLALEVDLGPNRVLCVDQVLELDATVENETATYTWTSDNGFSSSEPNVTLTTTGNYTVTVQTASGCTAIGTLFLEVSTNEIDAEFAVSSQVFTGEVLVAVDISFPLPEVVEWQVPEGVTVVKQDSDEVELIFDQAGEYEITLVTQRGDCIAQKTKKVLVIAKDGSVNEDDDSRKLVEDFIIYPNPTTGRFTADVSLSERGNISIKIFNFANNAMMASERGTGDTSYSIPFDLSGMPSGVYAVLLETPYGSSLRKIIVR